MRIFLSAAAGTLTLVSAHEKEKKLLQCLVSCLAGGESDEVNLNVNRGFLVVLVSGRKVISQLCKDPATYRGKNLDKFQ